MNHFQHFLDAQRKKQFSKRLAVVCADEKLVLQGVAQATDEKIIVPLLVGQSDLIEKLLEEIGRSDLRSAIVPADGPEQAAAKAVKLVREDKADFLMKGNLQTSQLLRAVLDRDTGLRTGRFLSHLSFVSLPRYPRLLGVTDAGLNIAPDVKAKQHIIQNAVDAFQALKDQRPHVAVLTSVEYENPEMPDTVDAAALKKKWEQGEITGCLLEGPIAMDLALNPEAARIKGFDSPVAGKADILVMPQLVSGNILSKALREFADSTTVGVVLGASVPIVLTSRGASFDTKYTSIVVVSHLLP